MAAGRNDGVGSNGPGLRRRIDRAARSISDQHRQLDSLYDDLMDALERGDGARARLVFLRFGDALNAHFSLEESFFFPAVHGLYPAAEAELASLSLEHERFDRNLVEVSERLRSDDLSSAADGLDGLASALATHEKREEALLHTILARKES